MATKKYDAVATIGKYTDSQGNEKKRYLNVGVVMETEHGLSLKLECVPTNPEWTGWISFFEPKDNVRQITPAQEKHSEAKANAYQTQAIDETDIPF